MCDQSLIFSLFACAGGGWAGVSQWLMQAGEDSKPYGPFHIISKLAWAQPSTAGASVAIDGGRLKPLRGLL